MNKHLIQIALAFVACCARGQGAFQYDQQSSTVETLPASGTVGLRPGLAQSFVPALSSVDFVRLYLSDPVLNSSGATVYLNLWANSVTNGTFLGATTPIFIPSGFAGYTNLFFSSSIILSPGATYWFEPIRQSGDFPVDAQLLPDFSYPNGTAVIPPAISGFDLWFREGIIVPEPSSLSLVLIGLAGIASPQAIKPLNGNLNESERES